MADSDLQLSDANLTVYYGPRGAEFEVDIA
jgi:hypothetical protein